MPGNLTSVLTVQQRIVELAQRSPAMPPQAKCSAFFSLAHHIDLDWLEAAFQLKKEFFDRLIANGKKYKVAIVAAMRKMIATLNTMIKTNTRWMEHRAPSQKF